LDTGVDFVQNEHPLNIADSWNFTYLQPRGSFQSPSVDRYWFEARAPHMDTELVDFLLSIPPYERIEQRVYKKMIASRRYPKIRDIPCTNSGKPINPYFFREYSAMAARYVLRKAAATVLGAGSENGEVRGREFRDLSEDFRNEPKLISDILQPMLDAEVFPSDIFDYSGIHNIVAEHYQAKQSREYVLSLLISYGLALKYFLYDDFSGVPADMYAA
jgi:hypothetical protein